MISIAFSIIVSTPFASSALLMSTRMSGSIPHSMFSLFASSNGLAENRTIHPFGISLDSGSPPPPPLLSPTMVHFGAYCILQMKSFVALNDIRFTKITTGRSHLISGCGAVYIGFGVEKSECPFPILCVMWFVSVFSLKKNDASISLLLTVPPPLLRTSIIKPLHPANTVKIAFIFALLKPLENCCIECNQPDCLQWVCSACLPQFGNCFLSIFLC